MRSHERLEELIAADALGGLDEADRGDMLNEMSSHGDDCAECLRLVSDYSEVAGRLAMSLDPLPLTAGAEERLLTMARRPRPAREPGTTPGAPAVGGLDGDGPDLQERPIPIGSSPGARRRTWVSAVAVAAVAALVAGVVGYSIRAPGTDQSRFLAFLATPSTRIVVLEGAPGQQLAVALRDGESSAWVVGTDLPTPSNAGVYELWFRPAGGTAMMPGGTFVPSDGAVLAPATIGTDVDLLAVTVEPKGGSDRPSTKPIFVSSA